MPGRRGRCSSLKAGSISFRKQIVVYYEDNAEFNFKGRASATPCVVWMPTPISRALPRRGKRVFCGERFRLGPKAVFLKARFVLVWLIIKGSHARHGASVCSRRRSKKSREGLLILHSILGASRGSGRKAARGLERTLLNADIFRDIKLAVQEQIDNFRIEL